MENTHTELLKGLNQYGKQEIKRGCVELSLNWLHSWSFLDYQNSENELKLSQNVTSVQGNLQEMPQRYGPNREENLSN